MATKISDAAVTRTGATAAATDMVPLGTGDGDPPANIALPDLLAAASGLTTSPGLRGESGNSARTASGPGGVITACGDSNTNGRPGFGYGVQSQLLAPGGPCEGWTFNNYGVNGSIIGGAGWASTASLTTNNGTPGNYTAKDVVDTDPDIIALRLGTNDVNNASARSAHGTEANLRANHKILIDFFLENSRALIVLWMPKLSYTSNPDEFAPGIPGFADVADYEEAQRRLNVVYREWVGVSDRVVVVDMAKHLYEEDYCDNKATDQLDPITGNPSQYDSLHETDEGHLRCVQAIAKAIDNSRRTIPRATATVLYDPEEVVTAAFWSIRVPCRTRSGDLLTFELNPAMLIGGSLGTSLTCNADDNIVEALRDWQSIGRLYGRAEIYRVLLNLPAVTDGYGLVFHNSGRVYTFDSLTFTQLVTATDPDYVVFTVGGIDPSWNAGDLTGVVTIFARSVKAIPFGPYTPKTQPDVIVPVPGAAWLMGGDITSLAVKKIVAIRGAFNGDLQVEVREANIADGRYVAEATYAAGKILARGTISAGIRYQELTLDPDGQYSGNPTLNSSASFLATFVTSGTASVPHTVTVSWR